MSRNGKGKGKAGQEQASQAKQAAKAEEQVITTAAGPEAAAGIPEAAEAAGPDVLTVLHTVQTNVPIRLPKKAEGIRVTTRDGGKQAIVWADDLRGENPLHGCGPFSLVEAGRRGKKGEAGFITVEGEVTVKAGKAAIPAKAAAAPSADTPEAIAYREAQAKAKALAAEAKAKVAAAQAEAKAARDKAKAEREAIKAAAKAAHEAKMAEGRYHGISGCALARWMGAKGWNANQAEAVLKAIGIELAMPGIRLQVASGKQGIRGAIPEVSDEQAAELEAKRAEYQTQAEAAKAAKAALKAEARAQKAAQAAVAKAEAQVKKAQERAAAAVAKAKAMTEAAEAMRAAAAGAAA